MIIFLIILGVISLAIYLSHRKNKKKQKERILGLFDELNNFGNQIKIQGGFKPIHSDAMLKQGEDAYLETNSSLAETRAVRYHQSAMTGFRVAKGLYVGGSSGKSESKPEWRTLDEGKLTLTNKRLIFDGEKENRVIPIEKVVSVKPWSDAIEVSLENRQKSMVFPVPNPYIWMITIQILTRTIDPKNLKNIEVLTEGDNFKINFDDQK